MPVACARLRLIVLPLALPRARLRRHRRRPQRARPTCRPHKTLYQRRPDRPLPARRRLAVPARRRQDQGLAQHFQRQTVDRRLEPVTRPQRVERHGRRATSRSPAAGRLVPQGLPAAQRGQALSLGRALRVGQLPLAGLAQRPAARHEHAAPTCRSSSACPPALKRGAVNRLVVRVDDRRAADRLPARGPVDHRRRRPAAGGTTAASCARSTCARSTRVDFNTVQVQPDLPCATCARDVRFTRHGAQLRRRRAARRASPARFGAAERRPGHAPRSAPSGFATFTRTHARSASRGCGRPAARTSTTSRLHARARAGRRLAAAGSLQTRHPLDQGRRRPPDAQRPAAEPPRRRPARGLAELRASRSTTPIRDQQLAPGQGARARRCMRSHYPLHPYTHELADQLGPAALVGDPGLRAQDAVPRRRRSCASSPRNELRDEHPDQRQPPVGDRVVDRQRARRSRPGPVQGYYIKRAVKTRQGAGPDAPRRPRGRRLPVGRLPAASTRRSTSSASTSTSAGTRAPTARSPTATLLSAYLDSVRACYPNKAIVVTETAPRPTATARSRRRAPTPFQQDFVNYHFGVYATKPWLSRRDLLGARGVPRPARLGGRQPAARPRRCTRRA